MESETTSGNDFVLRVWVRNQWSILSVEHQSTNYVQCKCCCIITHVALSICSLHLQQVHNCVWNVTGACPHCVQVFFTQLLIQLQEDVMLGDLLLQEMFIANMCSDIYNIQDFV